MKKFFIIIAVFIALLVIVYNVGFEIGGVKIGKQYDEIGIHNNFELANSPFAKQYLSEKDLVVINLWATWCKPCVEEIPNIQKLSNENPDTKFIFLSIDTDKTKLQNFLSKNKIEDITFENADYRWAIRNFLEGRKENSLIKTDIVPITYFLKNGKVIHREIGGLEYNDLKTLLQKYK